MPPILPSGTPRTTALIVLAIGVAVAAYLYTGWGRSCCAPPPPQFLVGGKDHLPPTDEIMPADFALHVSGGNGTVAPPYHYEFEIAVDSGGRGTLNYWAGYDKDARHQVTGRFTVDWSTRQRWWSIANTLRDAPGRRPQSEIPIGGASSTISLHYLASDKLIEPWQPAPWAARADTLAELVRAAVPDSLWALTKDAQRQLQ